MKTPSPALTPFVRSDAVGALLAETLGAPEAEFSLAELGRSIGAAPAVVHREVGRLVEAGVLRERYVGRNRMVSANDDHPLFGPMREIIAATYGPVPTLREAFAQVEGVEKVFLYGSWAARRAGQQGAFPNDLDVLVVGAPSRRVLAQIAAEAGERLGMPVNVTRLSAQEWESTEPSPFVRTVRARPFVDVASGELYE